MDGGGSTRPDSETTPQAPPAKKKRKSELSDLGSGSSLPTPSRFTRSQVVPDWTVKEMLVLVTEVASINDDFLKSLSTYQRWKMISDNCIAMGVNRSLNECKRKWETMFADYKKIKDWESGSGNVSYWGLEGEKEERGLPASFDQEVYNSICDFVRAQEDRPDSDIDSESEGLTRKIKTSVADAVADPGISGVNSSTRKNVKSNANKLREAAKMLEENAQLIHTILGDELSAGGANPLMDVNNPDHQMECTRRQADELIKVFGTLADNLNLFVGLMKKGG